jgi:outer membrane protein assembly factor BamB
MYCSGHFRSLLLTAAILLPGTVFAQISSSPENTQVNRTEVHLRWGPRPGVSRYRLQLASDRAFADILFDRVVAANDYQINDLPPGWYYWRIAPLTDRLGEFSSAGAIEVKRTLRESPTPLPSPPTVNNSTRPRVGTSDPIVVRGGWRSAVGDIAHPVLAHLRSPARFDLVGVNSDGVMFALDAASGVACWSTGRRTPNSASIFSGSSTVLLLRSRAGLDNLLVLSGVNIVAIEGATGHELWRTTLPVPAGSGTVTSDNRSAEIILVENQVGNSLGNSSPRLFVLDANTGNILAQTRLSHRVLGAPLALSGQGAGRIVLAYETGQVEIRDISGAVVRSGDAGSAATTPPLFVRGRHGDFIMIGTRSGLIALTAAELNPLGRVAIQDDAPRGVLAAEDLDGDGSPEVIMMTDRGRVIAVDASDGKTLWQASAPNEDQSVAFADVDGDRIFDVLLAGAQSFALALSGRDGSLVWKDNEAPGVAANHSLSVSPRSIVVLPYGTGALLIAADLSRTGVRALEFPKATAPLSH